MKTRLPSGSSCQCTCNIMEKNKHLFYDMVTASLEKENRLRREARSLRAKVRAMPYGSPGIDRQVEALRNMKRSAQITKANREGMERGYAMGRADAATAANTKADMRIALTSRAAQARAEKANAHAKRLEAERRAVTDFIREQHPDLTDDLKIFMSKRTRKEAEP